MGVFGLNVCSKLRPVTTVHIRRTRDDLHRMALDTRVGRECQVKNNVPPTKTRRFVVMIFNGESVRTIQRGVTKRIRKSRVVRAGLVVADVAVRWVERKSVSSKSGSRRRLHLEVNSFNDSTISSKVF